MVSAPSLFMYPTFELRHGIRYGDGSRDTFDHGQRASLSTYQAGLKELVNASRTQTLRGQDVNSQSSCYSTGSITCLYALRESLPPEVSTPSTVLNPASFGLDYEQRLFEAMPQSRGLAEALDQEGPGGLVSRVSLPWLLPMVRQTLAHFLRESVGLASHWRSCYRRGEAILNGAGVKLTFFPNHQTSGYGLIYKQRQKCELRCERFRLQSLMAGSAGASAAPASASSSASPPEAALIKCVVDMSKRRDGKGQTDLRPRDQWQAFTLNKIEPYNHNTKIYHFDFPADSKDKVTGIQVAGALLVKSPDGEAEIKDEKGKPVVRPYTPISPPNQAGNLTLMIKEYKVLHCPLSTA